MFAVAARVTSSFKTCLKFLSFIWKFLDKRCELGCMSIHSGRDLFVLGKHILKCLQWFSSFFPKFLDVNIQKVSGGSKCLRGVLSQGFYDSACNFIQKCSWSIPKASLWIISGLLVFYEASYFAIEIFLAWFYLLKQMGKVINSWRREAGNKMDKLQVIFCVGPLSVSFISFDQRLFCAENLKHFFLFFSFFLVGVGRGWGLKRWGNIL